jgi:hypothetical protein
MALAYARERRQGRSPWSDERPASIVHHPDVRRMLLLMRAKTEAARAICLSAGVAADLARLSTDAAEREAAGLRSELLTPIAKAWSTDVGVEVASLGVQVHGGMGFIEETGAAQFYRDARIAPIYEGTNGIQAIDLVGRKLTMEDGRAVRELLAEMSGALQVVQATPSLSTAGPPLRAGLEALEQASSWLADHQGPDALAGAAAYLALWGDVLGGVLLIRMAAAAMGDPAYAAERSLIVRIYAGQVLAGAPGRLEAIRAGAGDLEAAGSVLA